MALLYPKGSAGFYMLHPNPCHEQKRSQPIKQARKFNSHLQVWWELPKNFSRFTGALIFVSAIAP